MAPPPLRLGIIGGSGLGDALGIEAGKAKSRKVKTPFGSPSSPITLTTWNGVEIALLQRHGIGHVHPPSFVPYRANIFALKSLGVTHIIASGATGSLREDIHPGELVVVDQVIDRTSRRAGTFYEKAAVHVEFSQPFCPVMREWLLQAARRLSASGPESTRVKVHPKGTYICMEGPSFSTVAESNLHRAWGGDLIGMTAMPEAKLAREAEIAYALIALPTDYDCWRPHDASKGQQQLLIEIIGNLQKASAAGIALIKAALADVSMLRDRSSPAHNALELAIWSNKKRIPKAQVQRLKVLWGRWF